jgi:hypothetical protein
MSDLLGTIASHVQEARERIGRLNPDSATDREAALEALCGLYERFVVPAAALAEDGKGGPRYFDLQRIAGSDFPDLLLGSLALDVPGLPREAPPDSVLAPLLDEYGFDIGTPEKRRAFFQAWTAQRAVHLSRELLAFFGNGTAALPERREAELSAFRRLLAQPLPDLERGLLEGIVRAREAECGDGSGRGR